MLNSPNQQPLISHRWIKTQQTSIEWVTNFTWTCWSHMSLEFLDIYLTPKPSSPSSELQPSHAEQMSPLGVFSFSLHLPSLLSLLWTHSQVLFWRMNIKILAGSLRSNIDPFPFYLETPSFSMTKLYVVFQELNQTDNCGHSVIKTCSLDFWTIDNL